MIFFILCCAFLYYFKKKHQNKKNIINKFCVHKTNNKTEQVDVSMMRKSLECKDTGLEMKATNKSTNDFIKNNAKNNAKNIGNTCFMYIIFNFTYNKSYSFFCLNKCFND